MSFFIFYLESKLPKISAKQYFLNANTDYYGLFSERSLFELQRKRNYREYYLIRKLSNKI